MKNERTAPDATMPGAPAAEERPPLKLHQSQTITEEDLKNMSSDDFKDYVLYIAGDDPNCLEATAAMNGSSYAAETSIVDVFGAAQLPDFVDGVPCLHCKRDGAVHRGSAAISFLQAAGGGALAM